MKDASGHEHDDKGLFTSSGGGVTPASELKKKSTEELAKINPWDDEKTRKKRWKEDSPQAMTELADLLETLDDFSLENQERVVEAWIEEKGYKLGNIMNAWRLTLVGEGKGPGMFDISAFLGKEETLRRMRRAIKVLGQAKSEE